MVSNYLTLGVKNREADSGIYMRKGLGFALVCFLGGKESHLNLKDFCLPADILVNYRSIFGSVLWTGNVIKLSLGGWLVFFCFFTTLNSLLHIQPVKKAFPNLHHSSQANLSGLVLVSG